MQMFKVKKEAGFTFIELMVAAGLVAVLLLITVPLYRGYVAETRTTDALNALKALELEVRAPARASDGLLACDDSLVSPTNLQSDYLKLRITSAPNDIANPNGPLGYAAAIDVLATIDIHGATGVEVARLFHEELKGQRPGTVIDGVMTDSAVAYAVRLSPPGEPYCDIATAGVARAPAVSAASNRAPVAGQQVDLGQTKEDTATTITLSRLISASWDPDGDSLSVAAMSASSGVISGDASAGFVYTPAKDFHGDDVAIQFEVSDGSESASGTAMIDVTSVVDPPIIELTLSAEQQIMNTGTDGRAVVTGLQTGGDMKGLTLEFSVVGNAGGSATATSGPVIFNYGTQSNNNAISAWRPSNFTIALGGTDYATGINIADGSNHRVTIGWDSATGVLKVFDNGKPVKQFDNVSQGSAVPGMGHLVIGQKMNNPASGDGWNAGEHYSGQVFGTTLSTHVYSDQEIAGAPLYARNQNIVADLRNQGSGMIDLTGQHRVSMQGDFSTSKVQVDTGLALIPPGSEVSISVKAQPGDNDSQLTSLTLSGLGSLTVTDGTNSGSGSVDITNWNQSQIRMTLPSGLASNTTIKLQAVASDGTDDAQAEVTKVLKMKP